MNLPVFTLQFPNKSIFISPQAIRDINYLEILETFFWGLKEETNYQKDYSKSFYRNGTIDSIYFPINREPVKVFITSGKNKFEIPYQILRQTHPKIIILYLETIINNSEFYNGSSIC